MDKMQKQLFFIERANEIHNNKYDYSKVEYLNANSKVCIICPTHGETSQRALDHLRGYGCFKCANLVSKKENELSDLIQKKIINVVYNASTKVYVYTKKEA